MKRSEVLLIRIPGGKNKRKIDTTLKTLRKKYKKKAQNWEETHWLVGDIKITWEED